MYALLFSLLVCMCRYASLYFCVAIDPDDNELIILEIIHRYVELLDKYFGSVSFHVMHEAVINFMTSLHENCSYNELLLCESVHLI